MNTPANDTWLTAGALRSIHGLTDGAIAKVRAAAKKGTVRWRQSAYCRTDKAYNVADVLSFLNIAAPAAHPANRKEAAL